jgi:nitroimidazol reductase NimA-like FMN-containing flavoprotein (pyridoxamine 5'-phosphate oxidase superfamily)
MLSPTQRAQYLAIIDAANDLTIATVREDGYPQATTVSFVHDDGKLYFGTWTQSQKAKNLAQNDKVSVTVDLPYESWNEIKGVSLGGRARRVTAPEEMGKVGSLMMQKFPQLAQFVSGDAPDMAIFRVDPEVVSILDYTKGFGHTEFAAV